VDAPTPRFTALVAVKDGARAPRLVLKIRRQLEKRNFAHRTFSCIDNLPLEGHDSRPRPPAPQSLMLRHRRW
jgi:hypothetical protein